ncbi:MAG: hypothetical protein AABZ47_12610 [Planctomycetota bacterium]
MTIGSRFPTYLRFTGSLGNCRVVVVAAVFVVFSSAWAGETNTRQEKQKSGRPANSRYTESKSNRRPTVHQPTRTKTIRRPNTTNPSAQPQRNSLLNRGPAATRPEIPIRRTDVGTSFSRVPLADRAQAAQVDNRPPRRSFPFGIATPGSSVNAITNPRSVLGRIDSSRRRSQSLHVPNDSVRRLISRRNGCANVGPRAVDLLDSRYDRDRTFVLRNRSYHRCYTYPRRHQFHSIVYGYSPFYSWRDYGPSVYRDPGPYYRDDNPVSPVPPTAAPSEVRAPVSDEPLPSYELQAAPPKSQFSEPLVNGLLDEAAAAFSKGDYPLAQEHYLHAVFAGDDSGLAKLFYGVSCFARGEYALASAAIRGAMLESPDFVTDPIDIRTLYGDGNEAVLDLQIDQLVQDLMIPSENSADVGDRHSRFLLGYLYYASGRADLAATVFARLASRHPEDPLLSSLEQAANDAATTMQPESQPE